MFRNALALALLSAASLSPELAHASNATAARRIDAQIVSLATSHVPMLSRPNDVAYTILEAAGVKHKDPEPHEGG